ncbi:hypothetical protein SISSUDRAFT_1024001 [Sistotremastrum suecicum HHB10207 ss-3]|uniref:Uncharacterized protein n=1 Tax=Sistotremastrum suecicum HHB10207 ss-3 TaxID=1314776 RepID=A0A166BRI8_9AGAM|nr:hypothetical protein SISSUDRAFT_1024001 [Sistotremastrum suecicum HHB10207 ss-3]
MPTHGHNAFELSEQQVQDSFHAYLQSSLAQVKAEKLIDAEMLGSAESDLMITGPALCLYFAALRSVTYPPSVPLPRTSKSLPPIDLSPTNCPPAFIPFLRVWSNNVPAIQSLSPEHQHDLARIICGLESLSFPIPENITRIAAELRAVSIEISQRRTFQERFGQDLQAAIDHDTTDGESASPGIGRRITASFVPPPSYETATTPSPSPQPSPRISSYAFPEPQIPNLSAPSLTVPQSSSSSHSRSRSRTPSPSPPSPTVLPPDAPAIQIIRETLYACMAEVLSTNPSLQSLISTNPPRGYFATVSLAILYASTSSISPDGAVIGVTGQTLKLSECPREVRPLMSEFAGIGALAREIEEEDNDAAMELAQRDQPIPGPRIERVKRILENGLGAELARDGERSPSPEGRAVVFANRINALAMKMMGLPAFKERQRDIFKVLKGVLGH